MKNENFPQPSEASALQVSELNVRDEDLGHNVWRFGDVSVFCAWSPTAEPLAGIVSANKTGEASESSVAADSTDQGQPDDIQAQTARSANFIITEDDIPLTLWRAKRINAVHSKIGGLFTLTDLRIVIPQLILAALNKVAPKGVPLYYVLHIGEVNKTSGPLSRLAGQMRREERNSATGGLAGRPIMDYETFRVLLEMFDEIRSEMDLTSIKKKVPLTDIETPLTDAAYFEHYSPLRRCRGYVVLDSRFSIVIDCAEEDVRSLLTIIQQAKLTDQGLEAPGFATVVLRVSMWDSSSEMHASLDDLVQISRSSDASTQGQILLNFALAGIGILLSLTPLPYARPVQLVAPMLIYAMAAITHAFFALTGFRLFNRLGILCLLLATVLAILIFSFPSFVIPFLPSTP